jgi:hypothetical protein
VRLESVLFKGDITVKSLRVRGDDLVLETDPNDSVPGTLYVTPKDITGMMKLLMSRAFIGYMCTFPARYRRAKKRLADTGSASESWW